MPNAGRAWCHPAGLLFLELEKVKIVTAVFLFLGAGEGLVGNGEERKTGGQGERFLRAGQQHVDAERVHLDLDAGE